MSFFFANLDFTGFATLFLDFIPIVNAISLLLIVDTHVKYDLILMWITEEKQYIQKSLSNHCQPVRILLLHIS